METEREKLLGDRVFGANYSVISSNHRQHLHGIIEYLPNFKPDLVVFYGGYNETVQSAIYDPRPGYPFNYFYRSETSPFIKLLLENSAILGEIDEQFGVFTGINKLREMQRPYSDSWNTRIANNYFETLFLANKVTNTIYSRRFGQAKFLAFYQPYQVPIEFLSKHYDIKKHIHNHEYVFDVSSEYDSLGKDIYSDIVHVNQQARDSMGVRLANIITDVIRERGWLTTAKSDY